MEVEGVVKQQAKGGAGDWTLHTLGQGCPLSRPRGTRGGAIRRIALTTIV